MAYQRFRRLTPGDKFIIHRIKFAVKVGTKYVRAQICYVRVSPFLQTMDEVDSAILQAVQLKYAGAKDKTGQIQIFENGISDRQYLKSIDDFKHVNMSLDLSKEELFDVNNPAAGGERISLDFPVDLYYKEDNIVQIFGNELSKVLFMGDNEWISLKAKIRSTFVPFSIFFK